MKAQRFLSDKKTNSLINIGLLIIFLGGFVLRIVYWLQNRNLFIDEVNVVRNLYERGYAELLEPLAYEQYAPPLFLWVQKTFASLFGYDELAMRFFPLLCGLASLFIFYKLLLLFMSRKVVWYPLGLFAFGMIYIHYSATVKQYMPDAFITMLLLFFAKKNDLHKEGAVRFFIQWFLIGSLAIWSSMSSVFILAGVGLYYAMTIFKSKSYKKLPLLISIAACWIVQFALYYFIILAPQIHSEYLQNFHAPYFLHWSLTAQDWSHNYALLLGLLSKLGGHTFVSNTFQFLLLAIGVTTLFIKRKAEWVLLVIPLCCMLLAAFIKQYTLITRTVLFLFPVLLILIGIGADYLRVKTNNIILLPFILALFITVNNFKTIPILWTFQGEEEITLGFEFIQQNLAQDKKIYLSHLAIPAYEYYTKIHKNKAQFQDLRQAQKLQWDTNIEGLIAGLNDTACFIFTAGQGVHKENDVTKVLSKHMLLIDTFHQYQCHVYVYAPQ